jgi:hypothetical protein
MTICNLIQEQRNNPNLPATILEEWDNHGDTPLTTAVATGALNCIPLLVVVAGANVDAPNARGQTPLMLAALAGNERMVIKLLNNHANPCAFHNGANAILLTTVSRNSAEADARGGSIANTDAMDGILNNLMQAAPGRLNGLLARGTATPYEIATAFTDELCTWLSLAQSPDAAMRDAAVINLRRLPDLASDACATFFSVDQERGLTAVTHMPDLRAFLRSRRRSRHFGRPYSWDPVESGCQSRRYEHFAALVAGSDEESEFGARSH